MIINELTLAFARKSFGLWDALFLIVILFSFVSMIYGAYRAIMNLREANDKANLMQENILPKFFAKFGKVISIEADVRKRAVKFERNGTLFELNVIPFSRTDPAFPKELKMEIQSSIPNLREHFYIQHDTLFDFSLFKKPSGCQEVQLTMPKDFVFHGDNPQFLANLVAKDKIRNEIYKYQKKGSREFCICFASGVLTFTWIRGRDDGSDEIMWDDSWESESPEEEMKRLEQICQTAIVFYDELAKST